MSITYCFLLFIICLSLHVCDGRRLGAVIDKKPEKRLSSLIKKGEKPGFDTVDGESNVKTSMHKTDNSTTSKEIERDTLVSKSFERLKDQTRTTQKKMRMKDMEKKLRSLARHQNRSSLVSVSWRVPRKKSSEKHAGLDSDYCPPKTHPPSHN